MREFSLTLIVACWYVWSSASGAEPTIVRRPLPQGRSPIMALAISPDDQLVAATRGEQLFVYDLRGPRLAARLDDSNLAAEGRPGAAHLDLIRALAFDRSGEWLASGGLRTVKLWRRPRTNLSLAFTTRQPASAFAVSQHGVLAALGCEDGKIEIHSRRADGTVARVELVGHTAAVTGLAFATDGAILYSTSRDTTVRTWRTENGAEAGQVTTPAAIAALALLPDGENLATGHADGVIRIWRRADIESAVADGQQPAPTLELKGLNKPPVSLAACAGLPDQLLSGDEEGRLRLWNTGTGNPIRDFHRGAAITAAALRPDGGRVAAVGMDGIGRLWNTADGSQVAEFRLDEPTTRALNRADAAAKYAQACVEYRKEEHRESEETLKRETAVVEGARQAKDAADKAVVEKTEVVAKAVAERDAAVAKSKEAQTALKQADQKRVTSQANLDEAVDALKKASAAVENAASAANKDKDNKELQEALAAAEKSLAAARSKKQSDEESLTQATQAFREAQQRSQATEQAAYEPVQKAKNLERELQEAKNVAQGAVNFIATATAVLERATAAVPAAQQAVANCEALAASRENDRKLLAEAAQQPRKPLRAVAFSADGSKLVVAGEGAGISVLDAENGLPTAYFDQAGTAVLALACSTDGRLWVVRQDQSVHAGPLAGDWTMTRSIGRADDPATLVDRVLSLDFDPSGSLLATGGGLASIGGELKLWNAANGSLVREFAGAHGDTIHCVKFSPDGQFLATASADRLVKIFRVADGALVHTLAGHTHHVLGVCWQPDGRRLVSCGGDNTVKLWDIESQTALRTMRGDTYQIGEYKREVNSVAFIGDTEHILTSSGDRTVRMHRTSHIRDIRCFREGRSFMHAAVASSDGKMVIGGGSDGVLHFWNGESGYPQFSVEPGAPGKVLKVQ